MYKIYDIYDIIIENSKEKARTLPNKGKSMWKKVEYSQNQIKKAGKTILKKDLTPEEEQQALAVINNWRASHAFPLNTITMHLKRISGNQAVVVQRLKRIDSITNKLRRFSNMSLCAMQDLGGCRVIVETIDEVYEIVNRFKSSRIRHIFKEEYDYIKDPKESGYRCYHLVYKYHSDRSEDYNKNILIEIQVRTKLQHIWATAVETMGIYTKSALKAGCGDEDILRFFALSSSILANLENTTLTYSNAEEIKEIIEEARRINSKRNIISALSVIRVAIDFLGKDMFANEKGYYILILNYEKKTLKIRYFGNKIEVATDVYNNIEATRGKDIDTVLVSATSLDSLRAAYPNYFSDIGEFVEIISKIFEE